MKQFLLLFTLLSTTVSGQTLIEGKVTEASGQTIPMANVFIKDSYDGTTADENGNFSFTTTETGKQVLVVGIDRRAQLGLRHLEDFRHRALPSPG